VARQLRSSSSIELCSLRNKCRKAWNTARRTLNGFHLRVAQRNRGIDARGTGRGGQIRRRGRPAASRASGPNTTPLLDRNGPKRPTVADWQIAYGKGNATNRRGTRRPAGPSKTLAKSLQRGDVVVVWAPEACVLRKLLAFCKATE